MYAVLTLVLMHDKYLYALSDPKLSATEAFHWYQGVSLFNRKLSGPIEPSERNALWLAAAINGTNAFFHLDARTADETWPLKPPSSMDLNWLMMSEGKKEVMKLTPPSTDDAESVFRPLTWEEYYNVLTLHSSSALDCLPPKLVRRCGLNGDSSSENNIYYTAASTLAKSMNLDKPEAIVLNFLCFISAMSPGYKKLLEIKEPCALLLLAYWLGKVCQYEQWWLSRRSLLTCQAICIYLGRYHPNQSDIQELLRFPREKCGLSLC